MTSTPPDHADDLIAEDLRVYRTWLEQAETVEGPLPSSTAVSLEFSARLAAGQKCLELLHAVRHEWPCSDSDVREQIDYSAPAQIGGFQITGRPRVGAFGIVFPARDSAMQRDVAIKLPKPEFLAMPDFIERFTREAQAAAQLDHHNIVPVFSYGRYGITPYLVMPFIHGQTLAAWRSSQSGIAPRVAAEIVRQLAEGVAHAHAHGVLHRDIKPGNILLEPRRAAADNDQLPFQPKLTDFGLAKFLDDVHPPTQTGIVLGTLGYMSPEQAASGSAPIGVGTDIYSLGALLYFLITGEPPVAAAANLRDDSHGSLNLIQRGFQVPVELEVICQKCLEHSPDRRYASASLLADDLRRFLAGEPILARPISPLRRCGKWCRRHPAWATLLSVTAVSVVALIATSLWYNGRLSEQLQISEQARRTSQRQEQEMRRRAYVSDMALASRAWNSGNVPQTLNLLEQYRPQPDQTDLRDFAWYYLQRQYDRPSRVLGRHEGGATAVAMTADGKWGASSGDDGMIRIWSLPGGIMRSESSAPDGKGCVCLKFSPDGKRLVAGGVKGTIHIWDMPSGRLRHGFSGHESHINDVAYHPSGEFFATAGFDRTIRLWNSENGTLRGELKGHTDFLQKIAFHPDGDSLASTSRDGTLRLWNVPLLGFDDRLRDGVLFKAAASWPQLICFSPDTQHLVSTIRFDETLRFSLSDDSFGRQERMPPALVTPTENIRAMAWPRRDRLLAGTLAVIAADLQTQDTWEMHGHTDSVFGLAATPNAEWFLSCAADGDVRLWITPQTPDRISLDEPENLPHVLENLINTICIGKTLMAKQLKD